MTEKLTTDDLRRMSTSQVIDLLEERFERRLPLLWQLKISILLGAGDQGVHVVDPSPGGESSIERLNWEALAALLNSDPNSENAPRAKTSRSKR